MKKAIVWALVVIVLVAGTFYFVKRSANATPGKYDTFATCLKDKGVTFYGAFWCPHCQAQKKLFGSSVKNLPYVECSTPDGKGQTQVCIDKKISGYPTWEFADNTRESGELTLERLAEKSTCVLPASDGQSSTSNANATNAVNSNTNAMPATNSVSNTNT